MARVCHTNNCPVGVASQREELRARFPGCPGDLVNYFHFVAEEVCRLFLLPACPGSSCCILETSAAPVV
jgi:glutamate synthase domain-containing protein 2